MMGFEIEKRHFEGDHPPSVVKPAPPAVQKERVRFQELGQ